jgi:hypothetical protein
MTHYHSYGYVHSAPQKVPKVELRFACVRAAALTTCQQQHFWTTLILCLDPRARANPTFALALLLLRIAPVA